MEWKFLGVFFLLLIAFASHDMVRPAEGRTCASKSHGFRGMCMSDQNCGQVCKNEGFSDGECRGFRRRCFCTKIC